MIKIFRTIEGSIHQVNEASEGCWIALVNPTATEILDIAKEYNIEQDDLRAPLDEEERSRIEVEDNYTMILVDIPTIEERNDKEWYVTIPLSIIITEDIIFTVCLEDTPVLSAFMDGRVRNFYTYKKTRFILQILYKNATMYLHYLRIIDKKSEVVERKLHGSTRNQELIELLELEKSLVYFTTSLRANEVVLEKLLKTESIQRFPEDEDLLEDLLIEVRQADAVTFGGKTGSGIIVTNPPYGERLLDRQGAEALYRDFGRTWRGLENWRLLLLSSHPEFEHHFGRAADKKRKLYNGMIKCELYIYNSNSK